MIKKLSTATLLCSLGINGAFAGTMGESTYQFDGFYVGAGAGLANVFIKDTYTNSLDQLNVSHTNTLTDSNSGVMFEGQIGYGRMFQDNIYLGVKGSIYYTPLNYYLSSSQTLVDTTNVAVSTGEMQVRFNPVYNIDGVIGFELFPHFLPFVQAGVSFAEAKGTDIQSNGIVNLGGAVPPSRFATRNSLSGYKTGYNVGLGTAYQMNEHWMASGELVYNYLGKYKGSNTSNINANQGNYSYSYDRKFNQVSLFGTLSYLIPGS